MQANWRLGGGVLIDMDGRYIQVCSATVMGLVGLGRVIGAVALPGHLRWGQMLGRSSLSTLRCRREWWRWGKNGN